MLSRLLGDPIYESYARRAINALWKHRNTTTDLFSNDINIDTGLWISKVRLIELILIKVMHEVNKTFIILYISVSSDLYQSFDYDLILD